MKHRHGGENWKAAGRSSSLDLDRNPNANRGKEFRGVPWWKKNKNPKIGYDYKPGYKYDHKKPKPKKSRKKKSIDPEETAPDTGEEQLTEGEEPQEEDGLAEQAPEESTAQEEIKEEPKKKKGLFGRREKKLKQKAEDKPVIEEPNEEPKKVPTPTEKKDGF
jgi:hypothetical protein